MDVSKILRERAKKLHKKIILPEADDERIRKACDIIKKEEIAEVILLSNNDLEKNKLDDYAKRFWELRRHKGITEEEAYKIVSQPLYYAAFMVKDGLADGFVAGAVHSTPDVARAAIHCLGPDPEVSIVSSAFIIEVQDTAFGQEGVFFFADCGIVPEPSAEQLAKIAYSTANLAKDVLNFKPRVAMLSYSTKGSSSSAEVVKVRQAAKLAGELIKDGIVDGEIQADTAIVPLVAKIKDKHSKLEGRANILIFPNLAAGNISYKLIQRLARARAIGPILQGLNFPCSDLSRGCSVEDIVDVAALTAVRVKNK